MSYTANEVKSGIFITLSIGLLLTLTVMIGKFSATDTNTYHLRFSYISGLENNAPVYFSGHKVGKVDKIAVIPDHEKRISITIRIAKNINLHENSAAFIDTLGIMGEKFIELNPGTIDKPLLPDGGIIEGTAPVPMYLLIQKMNLLADRSEVLTDSLNTLAENINEILAGHDEDVGNMIANFRETSENVREMSEELKKHPWRLLRKR